MIELMNASLKTSSVEPWPGDEYLGEISSTSFIDGTSLANLLGFSNGVAFTANSAAGWLKFKKQEGQTVYIAKRPLRYRLSWNQLSAAGLVDGSARVTVRGLVYKVRLILGAEADPSAWLAGMGNYPDLARSSEWDRLIRRVSTNNPDPNHNWTNFTDAELGVSSGAGRSTLCQETIASISPGAIVGRGASAAAYFGYHFKTDGNQSSTFDHYGWRPLLELLDGQTPEPEPAVLAGTYKELAVPSTARAFQCTVAIGKKIYTYGGSFGVMNSVMEVYDIETNTWAVLETQGKPPPRHSAACCVLNGKMYMFGGSTTSAWSPFTNKAYVFDPATLTWTELADMPIAVSQHSAVAIHGKIYLFCGYNGAQTNAFNEYDPETNTYRTITHSQGNIHGHRAVVINNRMFVVGGVTGSTLRNRCISYDPVTNVWATYANSPVGNTYTTAGAIGDNLYLHGGSLNTNNTNHQRLFKFNLPSNTWTELPSGAGARFMAAMAVTDKALYIHGGTNNGSYTPMADLWEVK